MTKRANQAGFTLVELMMAVGVLGVISAIAVPQYLDYIDTARIATRHEGINQIRLFQEERRLAEGEYAAGIWDDAAGTYTLSNNIGWDPRSDIDKIAYTVTCGTLKSGTNPNQECTRTSGYTVVAVHVDDAALCREMVSGTPVDDC